MKLADQGTLRADADATIVDPELEWTIDTEAFASKSLPLRRVEGQGPGDGGGGAIKWKLGQ